MLVQATEVDYDYNNQRVVAVGNVQIYHNSSTVEADKVIYDQKTKRLRAEGNVRMTDADGKITYAAAIDLSDDYRDGFVDSLRLDTADQTRMAATRADRSEGRRDDGSGGVSNAEREELIKLRREVRQLRLERDILSKAAAWFAWETGTLPGSSGS